MRRILLIGSGPLPDEAEKSRPAAGLRTFQFFKPLQNANFEVKLVTIAMPECYTQIPEETEERLSDKCGRISLNKDDSDLVLKIQSIYDAFQPEAIIAINTFPSYIASMLNFHAPLWADLNGWIMAEAQAQAFKRGTNEYLGHYFSMESLILEKADKFSTVSKAQSFTLLGELGLKGRLNQESFAYPFVDHIPNATEWFKGEAEGENEAKEPYKFPGVPQNAFSLLWLGGYNNWMDEITLFKGVEDAMKLYEDIYFVSTGGELTGLDNKSFRKFKEMIEKSEFKDRFVFLGWVNSSEIPSIYRSVQAGLNVDKMCAETLTGARNRINEMMKFGLPIISTLGSEISYEMQMAGAGIGVESGRHEALTEAILKLYEMRHSTDFKQFGERAKNYVARNNYEHVMQPLLNWLKNPRPAPDRGVNVMFGGILKGLGLKSLWSYLQENGFKKSFKKFLQKFRH